MGLGLALLYPLSIKLWSQKLHLAPQSLLYLSQSHGLVNRNIPERCPTFFFFFKYLTPFPFPHSFVHFQPLVYFLNSITHPFHSPSFLFAHYFAPCLFLCPQCLKEAKRKCSDHHLRVWTRGLHLVLVRVWGSRYTGMLFVWMYIADLEFILV